MATLMYFLLSSLSFGYASANIVVYPLHNEQEMLATRMNCQVGESRSFRYSSVTNLWGSVEGQIALSGDVTVYCLGNDDDGKYGDEALKYIVELSHLTFTERSHSSPSERLVSLSSKREKRGVRDFFSNAWKKVKNFFNRLFGSGGDEEIKAEEGKSFSGGRRETESEDADNKDESPARKPVEEEDEGPETMNYEAIYSLPFEFVQLADGSIPEVRFAQEETDGRVRNFKRHVVDSFATQLATKPEMKKETSVIGEHLTNYSITVNSKTPETVQLAGTLPSALVDRRERYQVLVEKFITEDDILDLAPNSPSAALNDRDKMGLKAEQKQIFERGKLVSSSGLSTVSLFDSAEKKRTKRSADEEIMSFFQAHSQFELKLEKRKRRSVTEEKLQVLQAKSTRFKAASRFAEAEDSSAKQKLGNLLKSIGNNTTAFVMTIVDNPPTDDEKMQIVFEMVEEEVRLGLDHETYSMAAAVRKILSEEKMLSMCRQDFNRCRDFLQLLSLAGDSEAEQVLLACFSDGHLDLMSRQQVADILSEVSHPSGGFLSSLIARLEDSTLERELRGSLCLSAATIASQSQVPQLKSKMADVLVSMLETEVSTGCSASLLVLDTLEAMGNLGHLNTLKPVLKVSADCSNQKDIQIACAHALRHLSFMAEVQEWVLNVIKSQSCDVIRAVLGSLTDEIAFQEIAMDTENWPRNGFNGIDQVIKNELLSPSSDNFKCARKDAVRYFRKKKKCNEAKEILDILYSDDTEPWNPGSGSRHKRDLWDKLNCKEWTEDTAYRPIQDREEFESDKVEYNRRKSCLASRKLGVRGANAEIYAGMFAGVNDKSDPPKYKLFTKFVSGLNFLGHEMEIGSFHFYHRNGSTKAYVRIMGRTRQELSHEGCTPTELRYRPITHVPLFLFTISAVQVTLGIHLSSQLSLDTQCPGKETEVFNLQPLTNVRVGGEAMGTVLFVRGALSLGGDFNYKLQFTFTPQPDMCLEGYHGYDPMSIGFEAYYQLWNVVKEDWGKHRIWRPSSLKWQVKNGKHQPWFNQTCVLKLPSEDSDKNDESKVSDENSIPEFVQ